MSAHLQDFTARNPACSVAMFADITTRVVLASNNPENVAQEEMDDLLKCSMASGVLNDIDAALRCLAVESSAEPYAVFSSHAKGLLCLLGAEYSDDGVCLLLEGEVVLSKFISEAKTLYIDLKDGG